MTWEQLTSASIIATSARQRSEVYEAAGHLYGACARDRQDTPSKTRDWKTSVEQYGHAFKLIADHPAPLELCNSYTYALLQLMTVDPKARKDPTKRAAMKAAFDAALERATGANIKSELRLKQAAYEKKLGAL